MTKKKVLYEHNYRNELTCSLNVEGIFLVGEQSEPPSDKLGGEIFIASCMLVCLSLYIYMVYVRPDNEYHAHSLVCAHSHLCLTLHRGNQRTIETESELERDCTKVYHTSTRAALLQRYLSAYTSEG